MARRRNHTLLRRTGIALVLCLLGLPVLCQRIVNLQLIPAGSAVAVKFTITRGSSCSGYALLHSTDSLSFTRVADYPGVCGDSGADETKTANHNSPALNRINYYKVELPPGEVSPVRSVFVAAPATAALSAYPNPLSGSETMLRLRLMDESNAELSGFLYNAEGRPVCPLNGSARAGFASISLGSIGSGLYAIRLAAGGKSYTTRLLINR